MNSSYMNHWIAKRQEIDEMYTESTAKKAVILHLAFVVFPAIFAIALLTPQASGMTQAMIRVYPFVYLYLFMSGVHHVRWSRFTKQLRKRLDDDLCESLTGQPVSTR